MSVIELNSEIIVLIRKAKSSKLLRTTVTLTKLEDLEKLISEISQSNAVLEDELKEMEKLAHSAIFYCKKCDIFHKAGRALCV